MALSMVQGSEFGVQKADFGPEKDPGYTVTIWWWGPQGDFLLWNYDFVIKSNDLSVVELVYPESFS